ncbi:MAG: hypothetical protein RJB34_1215 [Pseudomonadota bacterium]|jgi:predicted Zn finger-like uncharacterized protein
MSFITRCPACATSFKVAAEQLSVSQGWVRCGHCAEIFDANQDIKPWIPAPPVLTSVVEEWSRPPDIPLNEPEPLLPLDMPSVDNDDLLNAVPDPEPRFVQQAKRQAFWSSTTVRAALWVAVVLCVLALLVQWVVHDRHRLAAWQPSLQPVLVSLCRPLGCSVEPVQQLKAVVIESSALVHLLGQLHALDVVLKNTQAWPVAAPSLELSLTDGQDRVLARRVLLAKDWPDAPSVLAAGQTWPVKLRLSIALPPNQVMAGYRVTLFYP